MANVFKKAPATGAQPLSFSLREAEPTYDKLAEKCESLRASIGKLDAEESDLLGKLFNRAPKPDDGMNSRVAELLDEAIDDADPLIDGIHARLLEVKALRDDTRAALAIATERLHKARHAASKVICDGVRDTYLTAVKALADALIAAHKANAAVAEITNGLQAADVVWTSYLPPAPAKMLGAPHDKQNRVAVWLRESARDKLIDPKIIPQDLKQ